MRRRFATAATLVQFWAGHAVAAPDCSGIASWGAAPVARASQDIEPDDLISLRDIGPYGDPYMRGLFSVSPDGRYIAYQLRRASADTNGYCLAMFVTDLQSQVPPVPIDIGGTPIWRTFSTPPVIDILTGGFAKITPQWSADGQWVAYLKRTDGPVQIWKARADGGGAEQVTHSAVDIETLLWSPGGSLLFSSRPSRIAQKADRDAEALNGFLYDERFQAGRSNRPYPTEPLPLEQFSIDPVTRSLRPANDGERAEMKAAADRLAFKPMSHTDSGAVAVKGPGAFATSALELKMPDGRVVRCTSPPCAGRITDIWWSDRLGRFVFMKNEGPADNATAFYQLSAEGTSARRLFSTPDLIFDCHLVGDDLICLRETSLRPTHFIRIDPARSRISEVFDPNPQYTSLRHGTVERLTWKNDFGLEAFGDLVLPRIRPQGRSLPLLLVQYTSRGFLRGGTGDEYPIQTLAAHGIAVLSLNHPPNSRVLHKNLSEADLAGIENVDWEDARSVQSSIDQGLKILLDRGQFDPAHIGITGISKGSRAVSFALLHSDRFAAAAYASGCDRFGNAMLFGDAGMKVMNTWRFPASTAPGWEAYWKAGTIEDNPALLSTPLLVQAADSEYLCSLFGFTQMKALNRPVEMYVFPDEFHVKTQPAHRRSAYRRSVQWFDFWLRDVRDDDPVDPHQYERWERMRDSLRVPPTAKEHPKAP